MLWYFLSLLMYVVVKVYVMNCEKVFREDY